MAKGKDATRTTIGVSESAGDVSLRKQAEEVLLKAGALQRAIFNSANFSSIATDAKGVIQIFNVGAERMLGYAAADVLNQITPANANNLELKWMYQAAVAGAWQTTPLVVDGIMYVTQRPNDVLALDAFSGDAIPVHLLTRDGDVTIAQAQALDPAEGVVRLIERQRDAPAAREPRCPMAGSNRVGRGRDRDGSARASRRCRGCRRRGQRCRSRPARCAAASGARTGRPPSRCG